MTLFWNRLTLFSGLVVVTCCHLQHQVSADPLQRAFAQINEHLEVEDDVEKSMAKVGDLLEQEKSKEPSARDRYLIAGLAKLVALESELDGPYVCSERVHDLVLSCVHGSGGDDKVLNLSSTSARRIDTLVHHLAQRRAELCQPVYAELYRELREHLEELMPGVGELEQFLDELIDRRLQQSSLQVSLKDAGRQVGMAQLSQVLTSQGPLERADGDIIRRRWPDDDDEVARKTQQVTSRQQLVKSCSSYASLLGPDVFEPALWEDKLLSGGRLNEPDFFDFYLAWARYRLCASVASQPAATGLPHLTRPS